MMRSPRGIAVLALLTGAPVAAGAEWTFESITRVRWESREHTLTFDRNIASTSDDSWWLTRVRLEAKGQLSDRWKTDIQLQDSRELGSRRPSVPFVAGSDGADPLDVRQAFMEYTGSGFVGRVGRQTLAFGEERLVGVSEWGNPGRSFDAIRLGWPKLGKGLELFLSSVVQVQPSGTTGWHANHSSHHDIFTGLYSHFAVGSGVKWEPYLLVRRSEKDVVYSAGTAGVARPFDIPQKIATGGLRVAGGASSKQHGFDYDLELAGQIGETRGRQATGGVFVSPGPAWLSHRAWAFHGGIGYSTALEDLPIKIYAEVNRASGDRNPSDNTSQSFLNLFPSNHRYYGVMDVISWRNMREIAITGSSTFGGVKARIEQHWFWLDNVNDTWFRPLTPAARRAPRNAGSELDVLLSRAWGKHITTDAGFCTFAAGPYLRSTGGATDARYGYFQTIFQW